MATTYTTAAAAKANLRGNQPRQLAKFLARLTDVIGGVDPLSAAGAVALKSVCTTGKKFMMLIGSSTYNYRMWAVVDPRDGRVLVIKSGNDAWVSANCRPWNGGDRL